MSDQNTNMSEEPEFNLFVGGLNKETQEPVIKEYFSKFGEIEKVNLIIDWVTNESKRCAIVVCKNKKTLNAILRKKKGHKIENRVVRVNKADTKKKGTKIIKTKKIFVGNLKDEIKKFHLKIHFEKYGHIKNLTYVKNSLETLVIAGTHAIIEYGNQNVAKRALDARDEHFILGLKLTVSPFKASKQSDISKVYELLSDFETHIVNEYVFAFFGGVFYNEIKIQLAQPNTVELLVHFVKSMEMQKTIAQGNYFSNNQSQFQQNYHDKSQEVENYSEYSNGIHSYNSAQNNYQRYSQEPYQSYQQQRCLQQSQQDQPYNQYQSYQSYQSYQKSQGEDYSYRGNNTKQYYGNDFNKYNSNFQHITQEANFFNEAWEEINRRDSPKSTDGEKGYLKLLPKVEFDFGNYGDFCYEELKDKLEGKVDMKSKEEIEEENLLKEVFLQ